MQEPRQVKLSIEVVVDVTDADALRAAALAQVAARSHASIEGPDTALAEEANERKRASGHPAQALELMYDAAASLASIPGVEVAEATWSAEPAGMAESPDFAALFEVCRCGEEDCAKCSGFQLPPRTAAVFWHVLSILADLAYEDVRTLGDDAVSSDGAWMVFDRYPRITERQGAAWRRQAARAFDDLRSDIEAGRWPLPRCTAEEMALHLAIEDAQGAVDDSWDAVEDILIPLDVHPGDFDWDMCSEMLFEDHDVLTLFSASLDGIEDPDSEVNQLTRMGDLRPPAWFRWFSHTEPRDERDTFRLQ